ncbi:hypothetical protein [Luteolibacter luteus]|uniref:Uncharacterized protein n=1 Tax=Luteolibacter luteus TaxID=2728835 RepID=A0A858RHN2_9BACT|nr:hypothetical protein [Luteolibacter luteus]QJE96215.1 hypothetical protein HHL09_10610 [Luteolibacter luteus]
MKPLLIAPWIIFVAAVGQGHNYDPTLAPFATEHRAKLAKIADKRDAAIKAPKDAYLASLESAEQEATLRKDSKVAEALGKEMVFVKFDCLSSAEGFPRKVITARKAFEKSLQQAESEAEREAKKINASYLADLNRIPLGQNATGLLVKQVASEKRALTSGVIGPIVNPETDIAGTTWWKYNKPEVTWKFTYTTEARLQDTWRMSFPKADEFTIHWDERNAAHLKLSKTGRVLLEGGMPSFVLSTGKDE